MIVNLLDTDYCTAVENYIADIEDNYKYLESYRMSFESSILLKESFNLEELNEAAGDYWEKFKAKIKAFINAIKELWNKFWSKIENKVMPDVEWLNNYSKALLKMEVPDLDYTMYGYFETQAVNFRNKLMGDNLIPSYNPNDTKLFEALESADKFRETYLKQFLVKDMSLNEGIKYMCRGKMEDPKNYGSVEIKAQMQTMVDYCLNYSKLARTLQKEKSDLERDLDRISRDINKIKVQENKESGAGTGSGNENPPQGGSTPNKPENLASSFTFAIQNASQHVLVEGCGYQDLPLLERLELFTEEGGVKISGETDKTKKGAVTRNDDGKVGAVDKEVKDNDTKETIAKRYTVYMTEVYNIIGIRMTIAEEVYTTYMQLLKYLGSEFTKKDRASKAKTAAEKKAEEENKKDGEKKEGGKIPTVSGGNGGKKITGGIRGALNSFKSFFKQ